MSIKKDTLMLAAFMTESKATATDFEQARQKLFKIGIKTSYDADRMLFSTVHTQKYQLNNEFLQEANGLILEMGTWRPLMVPPRTLCHNINTNEANKYLHQGLYHVYKVEDGTGFNMYWFKNRWVISTAKGYDMNDVKWETKTYQTLITECLQQLNISWEQFISGLHQNKCYSFGFRHVDFHKFHPNDKTHAIWFVQSVCLDKESDRYLWTDVEWSMESIHKQTMHIEPINNIQELYGMARNALNDFINNRNVLYGFILRSVKYETTGMHSDLFIESSLLAQIRKTWYDNKINTMCHDNSWNKETVVVLHAFLTNNKLFLELFKQYSNKFNSYSEVIVKIVTEMAIPDQHTEYKIAASCILHMINKNLKIDLSDKSLDYKIKFYTEYIMNANMVELLYPIMEKV